MINKTMIKSALTSLVVLAAVKKFAPLSVKKYL